MTKQARSYTEEFKQEAIGLALKSETVSSAAESLGIPDSTLHTWVQRARLGGETQSQPISSDKKDNVDVNQVLEDNRRLHKQVQRLQEETAILKKAAAYFVKDQE